MANITNYDYQIAIWPTFLQIFHELIVGVLKHNVRSVIVGTVPHSIPLEQGFMQDQIIASHMFWFASHVFWWTR